MTNAPPAAPISHLAAPSGPAAPPHAVRRHRRPHRHCPLEARHLCDGLRRLGHPSLQPGPLLGQLPLRRPRPDVVRRLVQHLGLAALHQARRARLRDRIALERLRAPLPLADQAHQLRNRRQHRLRPPGREHRVGRGAVPALPPRREALGPRRRLRGPPALHGLPDGVLPQPHLHRGALPAPQRRPVLGPLRAQALARGDRGLPPADPARARPRRHRADALVPRPRRPAL